MASEVKSTKRRSWGRASKREKITIIDRMDIEDTLQKIRTESKQNAEKDNTRIKTGSINLQHPELMDNSTLVECLKRIKVPVPTYPDGTLSRVRLLYLFRKHVTPQPQRVRRKDRRLRWQNWMDERKAQAGTEPMDIDRTGYDAWNNTGDGKCSIPLPRKRATDGNRDLSPPPEPKKPSLEVPCSPFAKISVTDELGPRTQPVLQTTKTTTTRIIKLKRPGKSKAVQT